MYTMTSHTPQNLAHAFFHDRLQLALALDQQAPGEAHRVDAQALARLGQPVRLGLAGDDVHVVEGEDDVVGERRALLAV
jgi:hypothetical protein